MMNNNAPQKAIIYCRVASVKQGQEQTAYALQEKLCREYASQNNYNVEELFSDAGVSGSLDNTGIQSMRSFLEEQTGEYSVIVEDMNRIARDIPTYTQIHAAIKEAGGKILISSEF